MIHFEPQDLPVKKVHQYLLGGVGPRPIALVSTLSKDGIPNLTPFSFFNCFGANPPMIAFSTSRRGRNATLKDTYYNLMDTKECVVQSVTYSMVEQINLASTEYPSDVNEFEKSGLTPVKSDLVKPFRVKESPFQMECLLREMRSFGEGGASANIAICEVIKFHIAEDIIEDGIISPKLIDLVARMSADYYCRANGDSIFIVKKPGQKIGVGYNSLPDFIKDSSVYSANDLGKFAGIEKIPGNDEVKYFIDAIKNEKIEGIENSPEAFYRYQMKKNHKRMLMIVLALAEENYPQKNLFIELTAKCALENNDLDFAWLTALCINKI
jgi:flavin reductase (DIM6/NTAB) family NADH-FMN oxidoreductase RutF